MSKIGRKPIFMGNVSVQVNGQTVTYKGKNASGSYLLPDCIKARIDGKNLELSISDGLLNRETKRLWGLHRALLANALLGAEVGFTKQLQINGLGFKAVVSGSKVVFTLGYTHKIELTLPKNVTLEVDKTGQALTFKSPDKEMLGKVCDEVRSMRPPEPYKGTGVKYLTEVIVRKAGKTKTTTGA